METSAWTCRPHDIQTNANLAANRRQEERSQILAQSESSTCALCGTRGEPTTCVVGSDRRRPLANAYSNPEDAAMPKARPKSLLHRTWFRRAYALVQTTAVLSLTGCVELTYKRVRVGMVPGEYDRALDLTATTRTSQGLVQYSKTTSGQEDALLLTLSDIRRISGKMRVARSQAGTGWPPNDFYYILIGEFDCAMMGAAEAGPIDTLRLITQRMSDLPSERASKRGQILALAGLVRVLLRQTGIQDVGLPELPAGELVGIAPDEGFASLERDASGRLHVEYRVGQEP